MDQGDYDDVVQCVDINFYKFLFEIFSTVGQRNIAAIGTKVQDINKGK